MATETLTRGALPRLQWGPVITGVLCALAAQIVLGLFGATFGFAAAPAGEALGILAVVWGLVTPIVASFIGAHVAVRMTRETTDASVYLHGALVWCIGLIVGAIFITGSLASGAMTAGTAASGNIGVRAIERRATPTNRARAQTAAGDASKGAAEGTGAAGVAALLGLGGALLGAGVGKRVLTGRTMHRDRSRGSRVARPSRSVTTEDSGVAYGESGGRVTTRPPAGLGEMDPRLDERADDPTLRH